MFEWLIDLLPQNSEVIVVLLVVLIILVIAILIYLISNSLMLPILNKVVKKSATKLDDELVNHQVFSKLLKMIPFLFIYYAVTVIPYVTVSAVAVMQKMSVIAIIVLTLRLIFAFFSVINSVYSRVVSSKSRPIKGYLQLFQIFISVIAGIYIISLLLDQSPIALLTGIGGLTAVLLLIFKDTILSLVASIQLTSNDMLQVGDWIEMSSLGADGDVIDMALHTVKVQNFDKTIVTIPTSKLVDGSFKNWRGMSASGGRRIKRSINLDLNTIRFLSDDEIDNFSNYELLSKYIADKKEELLKENNTSNGNLNLLANKRMLTNVGTFRAYVVAYLRAHSKIRNDMTFLVRQLEPLAEGLPLQIYVFTNDIAWVNYEGIQSDIFDHLLAIIPEFGLRVFQKASGYDFRQINKRNS